MLTQIKGLHHVTSLASGANENNGFFTRTLGLRCVKKTVNFDAPEVYHLYYGDAAGTPGSVMTYFPFPNARRGRPGAGEVSETAFAVPRGATAWWVDRLAQHGVEGIQPQTRFGEARLRFNGPNGDGFRWSRLTITAPLGCRMESMMPMPFAGSIPRKCG